MNGLDHPTMGSTFARVHRDTVDVLLNQDITIPLHKMTILQYRIGGNHNTTSNSPQDSLLIISQKKNGTDLFHRICHSHL